MKKLICLIVAVVAGMAAFAQTPKEIVARMDAETTAREAEGYSMQIDIKMPILGTMPSKAWNLGDKTRLEATMMGVTVITWSDGVTSWTYTEKTNEIEIKPDDPSDNDSDLSVIDDLDGYDISLAKQTDKTWTIRCKKNSKNTDKDAPKNIEMEIEKGTYMPVSITAKASSVTMIMRDIHFGGVTEAQVTFRPSDYPNATIKDLR